MSSWTATPARTRPAVPGAWHEAPRPWQALRRHRNLRRFLAQGELEAAPDSDAQGTVYVTRASLASFLAQRRGLSGLGDGQTLLSMHDAARLTGFSRAQLGELARAGRLQRVGVGHQVSITRASLQHWAVGHRPELLRLLHAEE